MNRRLRGVVSVVAFLALAAPSLRATTALQLSNQDLANQADVIAIGTCVGLRTVWVERMLVTLATVQITESLKGSGGTVTVLIPGGIDANRPVPIAMSYAGAPQIVVDEEMFLFLDHDDDWGALNAYTILGFSQGKFSILTDSQGQRVVDRDLSRMNLVADRTSSGGVRTRRLLSDFKAETQRYLRNR